MLRMCLHALAVIPGMLVFFMAVSPARLFADTIPPVGTSVVNFTGKLSSSSNALHATISSTSGYWCKAVISRYKACTFWTSEVFPEDGLTAIDIYEKHSSDPTAKASTRFIASTDRDGSLRFTMASSGWSESDDLSMEFYIHIRGKRNTSVTLNHQLAEVKEVYVGSVNRPLRFDFPETARPPVEWHDTVDGTILDDGNYYMVSRLEKGDRYYFGVSTNVPDSTLFSVLTPEGDEVMLSSLKRYVPWDSFETNTTDFVTCLTNREERITVTSKYTTVSNENLSVTNVYTVVGVYTNAVDGLEPVVSNFVAVVTNVDMSVSGVQTTVEIVTNYEMCVHSIQTNIVTETNVSHVGICRDARRFIPTVSGDYVFLFRGSGAFSLYNARMAALPDGEDIEFSSPSGTHIPSGKALKLKLTCLRELASTNIYYTTDGTDPRISGVLYSSALRVSGPVVVRASLVLDDGDFGNVYTAYYYPARGDISEALGIDEFSWTLSGSPDRWFEDLEKTPDAYRTVRSIPLEHDGTVDLELRAAGEGVFSFRWRISSEEDWDEAVFCTNGIEVARISGETRWEDGLVSVNVAKDTVLVWSYSKDEESSEGDDCLWLSDFRFRSSQIGLSTGTRLVEVPYVWFEKYGIADVADALADSDLMTEEMISRTNAFPRPLVESYVAGLDPTNVLSRFEVRIEMEDGVPSITWSPDLGDGRVYTIMGSETLSDDDWHAPATDSDRFFKVKVALP